MWYGVVCKVVMSCTSAVFSLAGVRDTVPCLAITAILLLLHCAEGFISQRIFFSLLQAVSTGTGDILVSTIFGNAFQ
jgi:hypothetical protein